jgi:hypothetical protein
MLRVFTLDLDGIETLNAYHWESYSNLTAEAEASEEQEQGDAHHQVACTEFEGYAKEDLYRAIKRPKGGRTLLTQGIKLLPRFGLRVMLETTIVF